MIHLHPLTGSPHRLVALEPARQRLLHQWARALARAPALTLRPGQLLFLQPELYIEDPHGRLTPYLVVGAGFTRQQDTSIDYTAYQWSMEGGAGLRVRLSRGIYLAPEVRLGSHAFPKATVALEFATGAASDREPASSLN